MSVKQTLEPISARLRHDEKVRFAEVCEEIGTTPSNAIRMFVVAFNRRGGFPFDPSNPLGFNRATLEAMGDAVTGKDVEGPFTTVNEAMAALDED